ncbi:MAG: RHS repeat-associated core domain-containing protein [Leptospirales bacterium]
MNAKYTTKFLFRVLTMVAILSATFMSELTAGVNPDGSFSHGITIEIPPGTAGMQPSISLGYNSNGGNGLVGKGWSLSGFATISRVDNGYGISGQPTDRYSGPGGLLVDVSNGMGKEYHTEQESFQKYEPDLNADGQPQSWVVTQPDGTKLFFGSIDNSRLEYAPTGEAVLGTYRVWALDQVLDLNGNFYKITYRKINGILLPEKVLYTRNDVHKLSRFRAVVFVYNDSSVYSDDNSVESPRSDAYTMRAQNTLTQMNYYLKEIEVRYDVEANCWTNIFCNDGKLVRSYELDYENSPVTGEKRLKSVTQFGATEAGEKGGSLEPQVFTYDDRHNKLNVDAVGDVTLTPLDDLTQAPNTKQLNNVASFNQAELNSQKYAVSGNRSIANTDGKINMKFCATGACFGNKIIEHTEGIREYQLQYAPIRSDGAFTKIDTAGNILYYYYIYVYDDFFLDDKGDLYYTRVNIRKECDVGKNNCDYWGESGKAVWNNMNKPKLVAKNFNIASFKTIHPGVGYRNNDYYSTYRIGFVTKSGDFYVMQHWNLDTDTNAKHNENDRALFIAPDVRDFQLAAAESSGWGLALNDVKIDFYLTNANSLHRFSFHGVHGVQGVQGAYFFAPRGSYGNVKSFAYNGRNVLAYTTGNNDLIVTDSERRKTLSTTPELPDGTGHQIYGLHFRDVQLGSMAFNGRTVYARTATNQLYKINMKPGVTGEEVYATKILIKNDITQNQYNVSMGRLTMLDRDNNLYVKTDLGNILTVSANVKNFWTGFSKNESTGIHADCFITYDLPEQAQCQNNSSSANISEGFVHARTNLTGLKKKFLFAQKADRSLYLYLNNDTITVNGSGTKWLKIADAVASYTITENIFAILFSNGELYASDRLLFEDHIKNSIANNGAPTDIRSSMILVKQDVASFNFTGNKLATTTYAPTWSNLLRIEKFSIEVINGTQTRGDSQSLFSRPEVRSFQMVGHMVAVHNLDTTLSMYNFYSGALIENFTHKIRSFSLSSSRLGFTTYQNEFHYKDFWNAESVLAKSNIINCRSGDIEIDCVDYNYNLYRHRTGTAQTDFGVHSVFNGTDWNLLASDVREYSMTPTKLNVLGFDNTLREINKSDLSVASQTNNIAYYQYNENFKGFAKIALPSGTMNSIFNGIGGIKTIAYHHSFQVPETINLNARGSTSLFDPSPKVLVRLVKDEDGRGGLNILSSSYKFQNAKVYVGSEPGKSKSLGFETMEVTTPDDIKTVTIFNQSYDLTQKPRTTLVYASNGTLVKETNYQWLTSMQLSAYGVNLYLGLQLVLPESQETFNYFLGDGSVYSRSKIEYLNYDAYANVVKQKIQTGNATAYSSKETNIIESTYQYNLEKWMLGAVTFTSITDEGGTLLSKKSYTYDQKYNLKESGDFLIEKNSYISTGNEYDIYGNVTKSGIVNRNATVDQLDRSKIYEYDPVYATYPIKVSNQMGHTVVSDVDYATGKPTCVSDLYDKNITDNPSCLDLNPITYQYDQFKREILVMDASVAQDNVSTNATVQSTPWVKWTTYTANGVDPDKQNIFVKTRDESTASGYKWVRNYYDGLGRTWKETSLGLDAGKTRIKVIDYDNKGRIKRDTNSKIVGVTNHAWTNYEYDALGRVVNTTHPDGNISQVIYNKSCTVATDANNKSTQTCHDRLGRTTQFWDISPGTSKTYFAYDNMGRLINTTDADGDVTNIQYDSLGRKTSLSKVGEGTWSYAYFSIAPELKSTTDPKGNTINYRYDNLGRLRHVIDNTGKKREQYWYDQVPDSAIQSNYLGKLTRTLDDAGNTYYYYNQRRQLNLMVKNIDNINYSFHYTYDVAGRVEELTYPDGKIAKNIYGTSGTLRQVRLLETPGSSGSPIVTYEGPVTTGANTLTRYTGSRTHKTSVETEIAFDPVTFRPTSLKTTLPQVVDNQGAVVQPAGVQRNVAYTYDAVGNITQINDLVNSTRSQTFTYGRAYRLTHASGSYGEYDYTYSAGGNLIKKGDRTNYYNGATQCNNNPAPSQAVCADSEGNEYKYDANGNMINRAGRELVYNYLNRLTEVKDGNGGAEIYTYDFSGKRVKKKRADGTTVYNIAGLYEVSIDSNGTELHTKYIYGTAGDLAAQVTLHESDVTVAGLNRYSEYAKASLAIPGSGTWFKKLISDHFRGRQTSTQVYLFVLIALLLIGLYIRTNWKVYRKTPVNERRKMAPMALFTAIVFIFTFVFNGCEGEDVYTDVTLVAPIDLTGADEISTVPTSMYNDTTTVGQVRVGVLFFHPNFQGSTALVTDYEGKLVTEIHYKPYGEINRSASTGYDVSRYKYTGQEEDAETGLMYFGARYYDPGIGRFITQDTKVLEGTQGLNRYMYTYGNPMMYTDPSGNNPFLIIFIIVIAGVMSAVSNVSAACSIDGCSTGEMISAAINGFIGGAIQMGIQVYFTSFGMPGVGAVFGTFVSSLFTAAIDSETGALTKDDWINIAIQTSISAAMAGYSIHQNIKLNGKYIKPTVSSMITKEAIKKQALNVTDMAIGYGASVTEEYLNDQNSEDCSKSGTGDSCTTSTGSGDSEGSGSSPEEPTPSGDGDNEPGGDGDNDEPPGAVLSAPPPPTMEVMNFR